MKVITATPLTQAYVVMGFWVHVTKTGMEVHGNQSEMDLTENIIHYANLVEVAWDNLQPAESWGGVWEYDISCPYGEWLAETYVRNKLTMPSAEDCSAHIQWLITEAQ